MAFWDSFGQGYAIGTHIREGKARRKGQKLDNEIKQQRLEALKQAIRQANWMFKRRMAMDRQLREFFAKVFGVSVEEIDAILAGEQGVPPEGGRPGPTPPFQQTPPYSYPPRPAPPAQQYPPYSYPPLVETPAPAAPGAYDTAPIPRTVPGIMPLPPAPGAPAPQSGAPYLYGEGQGRQRPAQVGAPGPGLYDVPPPFPF